MEREAALAAIRFGYGMGPRHAPPGDASAMLDRLQGPDLIAARYPMATFDDQAEFARKLNKAQRARRKARGTNTEDSTKKAYQRLQRQVFVEGTVNLSRTMARALETPDGFRERLTRFWADHFTVIARRAQLRGVGVIYVEEAIRPNLLGRFADMLRAATLHPYMVLYLDQAASVGPNSDFAQRAKNKKNAAGLNENLAREVMELHSLGVGGAYTQDDVRQLAELLAGLRARADKPTSFDPKRGEPGAETVLGRSYGGKRPDFDSILQVIEDLAAHPDTARHIATKLVTHFVSDTPDPGLVDHLAARFTQTDGNLLAVYTAMLEHPAAWRPDLGKAKQPYDYITSALRGLGVSGDWLLDLKPKEQQSLMRAPMGRMGQPWEQPSGPDGWAEDAAHWITPQGMATRITWAMRLRRVSGLQIPDPRQFVEQALGPMASERVRFAAGAAESKIDGVGVVLASPDFQRR